MKPTACPRCDSDQVVKIADSPVKDKWQVYRCRECNYVWRSTEDLTDIARKVGYWKDNVLSYWQD